MGTEVSTLREQLKRLGLHTMADSVDHEADVAAKSGSSFTGFLGRLVELELAAKADRSIRERVRKARFPMLRTLESFDFRFQPSLPAAQVRELAGLGFVERAEPVLFVGACGTGKTHLAIALGLKACEARRSVLFTSAVQLMEQLAAAAVSKNLGPLLATLTRIDLLVCDLCRPRSYADDRPRSRTSALVRSGPRPEAPASPSA